MNEVKIIFEDTDLLVLDKPSGITVNRSETTKGDTIQDWLENNSKIKYSDDNSEKGLEFKNRGGIVHRIDKETSGILIVAKTKSAFEELQRQFKERIVKKSYIALSHGKVAPEEGVINIPVGRLPWNRKRFGVLAGGREALTRYRVIKSLEIQGEQMSLLEVYPETGRTHQIRVHLKYINHPIFGDEFYAGRKTGRNDRKILPRLFLHARKISFMHPTTQKIISLESPLPKELEGLIS